MPDLRKRLDRSIKTPPTTSHSPNLRKFTIRESMTSRCGLSLSMIVTANWCNTVVQQGGVCPDGKQSFPTSEQGLPNMVPPSVSQGRRVPPNGPTAVDGDGALEEPRLFGRNLCRVGHAELLLQVLRVFLGEKPCSSYQQDTQNVYYWVVAAMRSGMEIIRRHNQSNDRELYGTLMALMPCLIVEDYDKVNRTTYDRHV